MPNFRAILFDLDDTLLVDEAVSYEVLEQVAQQAEEKFKNLFSKSTDAANNCVAPVLASSGIDYTLSRGAPSAPCSSQASATLKAGSKIDPKLLVSDAATIAQELWRAGECYPFCRSIGISAFECLWGNFLGDSKDLTALRAWSQRYREEVFEKALLTQRGDFSELEVAARSLAQEFSSLRRQQQRLFPKTREVLEQLSSQFKLGLLTNGAPDLQREKIAASGCEDLFSAIVISGEYGVGKPEPAIFERLLQELGVTSSEAMMVGNNLERDIAGARAAGVTSVWMRLPGERESEIIHPDFVITDLQELLDLITANCELQTAN
ncbi:MAG: HAD family hydrolase [Chthoniobacterales bacterium]|nr:HAD family hydrolase [Chthoniobacterales bacterium]